MKNALWIKGYEGKYKVLPNGKIYSFVQNNEKGKLLRPRKSGSGYLMVSLLGEQKYIHQIVAEHYLVNPDNHTMIVFKDGNSMNVKISNLMWSDSVGRGKQRSTNEKKSHKRNGMINSIVSEKNLIKIAKILKHESHLYTQEEVAERFGMCRISLYRLRKTKEFQNAFLHV